MERGDRDADRDERYRYTDGDKDETWAREGDWRWGQEEDRDRDGDKGETWTREKQGWRWGQGRERGDRIRERGTGGWRKRGRRHGDREGAGTRHGRNQDCDGDGREMRQNRAVIDAHTEGQSQKDKARDRHSRGTKAEGRRERAFGELRPTS